MRELCKQFELLPHTFCALTALFNVFRVQVSQRRRHSKVPDANRVNAHQSAAGSVGGYGIISEDNAAEMPHWPV